MIQRIQSLYLTLVVILSLLFVRGSLLSFTDETGRLVKLMISGNLTDQAGQVISHVAELWPLVAILSLIALASVVTILLYSNRKVQLLLVKTVIILAVGLLAGLSYYAFSLTASAKMTLMPVFRMALPVLILLFSVLAYRGILKDEHLVRSYDRLR